MNLSAKTLAVTASHYDGTLEYAVHNMYALYQARATAEALRAIRQKRHFSFTRCVMTLLVFLKQENKQADVGEMLNKTNKPVEPACNCQVF